MRHIAATALSAAMLLWSAGATVAAVPPGYAPGKTTRVSVSASGDPANGSVSSQVLSANGRYLVFQSSASNLVTGVSGTHVYRRDLTAGVNELVSVTPLGVPSTSPALFPSVSADGRYVVFQSAANDLLDDNTGLVGFPQVFVRDMQAHHTALASASASGPADQGASLSGNAGAREISGDGRYAVFFSASTNLVPSTSNLKFQIYVKDLQTGTVICASLDTTGQPGNDNSSAPNISGDGMTVAFASQAANFSTASTMHVAQVFVRDAAGTLHLESVMSDGTAVPSLASGSPALSHDGRYLAFDSQARLDLARDTDASSLDVYLRDRLAGTTVLASRNSAPSSVTSNGAVISDDGRYVGFQSADVNLVTPDTNAATDVFLYDRDTEALTLVSLTDAELQANGTSNGASVSFDGNLVVFRSSAANLGSPTSPFAQLYLRDLNPNKPPVLQPFGKDLLAYEGQSVRLVWSFTDDDGSTSWTGTVDWGDGSGVKSLTLNSDKTFLLEHLYQPGAYDLTVAVTDNGGLTGTMTIHVVVSNLAPDFGLGTPVELAFDSRLRLETGFTDPGVGFETYTATVDYGDGSGAQTLALKDERFMLDHTYTTAGTFTVTVAISDSNGATTTATLSVTVRKYTYTWLEPSADSTSLFGRLLPVRFTVQRPDGSFVLDKSVRVEVRDLNGKVVAGPYLYGSSPSKNVVDNGHEYLVTVDTRSLPAGTYELRVSFASPDLTGSFSRVGTLSASVTR